MRCHNNGHTDLLYSISHITSIFNIEMPPTKTLKLIAVDTATGQEEEVQPPDPDLRNLPSVCFRGVTTLQEARELAKAIPKGGGCYWIATDEPCTHSFNGQHSEEPLRTADGLQILYNGVTTGLSKRFRDHLLRTDAAGGFGSVSGISVDILDYVAEQCRKPATHVKHAYTEDKKKLPKVFTGKTYEPIEDKVHFLKYMGAATFYERKIVTRSNTSYFKNGINVCDRKHQKHSWVFLYAPLDNDFVRSYVEITWRQRNGVPPLASYISGR